MSDFSAVLFVLGAAYALVAILWAGWYVDERDRNRHRPELVRSASRMALLAPVWPLVLIASGVLRFTRGLRRLIRDAR